jgi:hypothetical protein
VLEPISGKKFTSQLMVHSRQAYQLTCHPILLKQDHGPTQPGQKLRPYLKSSQSRAGRMAQEVEAPA